MRTLITMCLTATCVFAAAPLRAQEPVQAWVEGRYLQNRDRTQDLTLHTGPGRGLAAGVDFWRRFGIEVALDWSKPYESAGTVYIDYGLGSRRRVVERISQTAPDVSLFFAAHVVETNRFRVTLLVGLGAVPRRESQILEELPGPFLNELDYSSKGGPAFGANVPVRLIGGLSVVPSIHVVFYVPNDRPGVGFVRPSIGMRWTF